MEGVNHKYAMSLMQLVKHSGQGVSTAIDNLFGGHFSESQLMSAIFSLMEHDLTYIRILSRFMKLDPTIFAGIIGCISGESSALRSFAKNLAAKINIKDHQVLFDLLKLASGDADAVGRLNIAMNHELSPDHSHLIQSMVFLTKF